MKLVTEDKLECSKESCLKITLNNVAFIGEFHIMRVIKRRTG